MSELPVETPQSHNKLAQHPSVSPMPRARILWLKERLEFRANMLDLQEQFRQQGSELEITGMWDVTSDQLADADLILLEAFSRIDATVETMVARIRLESRVPLIMLTEDCDSSDQLVTALTAGVDAIWSLNTSTEILLARCKALLRRWLSGLSLLKT